MLYFSNNYRSRLYKLYVISILYLNNFIDTPSSIYIPWSMIKTFLETSTINKISFYKTDIPLQIFEFANKR